MRKLFGTDGIRGRAHEYPLDVQTMFALGATLAVRFRAAGAHGPVLMGMDTRESGPQIARALAAGLHSEGGEGRLIGVIPTPGVAFLCHTTDASAGISISASHNPYGDNGVKIFGHDGMKLSDNLEREIERELLAKREQVSVPELPELADSPDLVKRYEDFLVGAIGRGALRGSKIVLDAGNGAAYEIAPDVFRRAGALVEVMNDQPNGKNINENAGALHPERMAARVVEIGFDFGVAFDGDADRAIFADDAGKVRNGDEILYLWGTRLKKKGKLPGDTIVATVMSNFGFEKKLASEGIRLLRAHVGDKYVLEQMLEAKAILGGEQSGHLIDLSVHTTGDGVHTGLAFGELLRAERKKFSQIETFTAMPQILLNQKVSRKPPLERLGEYRAAVKAAEERLAGRGRILVRYSGTENLVRVMVEGEDKATIESIAHGLRDVLAREIG